MIGQYVADATVKSLQGLQGYNGGADALMVAPRSLDDVTM
jgi:hypothetical protein